jgi:hypothetical protein
MRAQLKSHHCCRNSRKLLTWSFLKLLCSFSLITSYKIDNKIRLVPSTRQA